jgi:hypothetical protein
MKGFIKITEVNQNDNYYIHIVKFNLLNEDYDGNAIMMKEQSPYKL